MKTIQSIINFIWNFILGIFKATPIAWKWVRNTTAALLLWLHTEGEALKDVLVNIKIPHLFGLTAYHVTVAAGATLIVAAQSKTLNPAATPVPTAPITTTVAPLSPPVPPTVPTTDIPTS